MGNTCCGEPIDFNGPVDLRHFDLLRNVGKGSFGKIKVIQKKDDKKIYALKYINKAKCIKMKAVNNIIQERRLLEEVQHVFVVNMRYAFQDDDNLFMVLDLMLGGDLRFHLDRNGPMKEEIVRFYIAEISSALHFLHSRKVVHRDLKPDNVLLDETGHVHLTDFNIAVKYSDGSLLKSVAGSMAYMAPEVVGKKGYHASPDWWSLGVVMYELLFGKRPFRGKTNEQLTEAIIHDTIQFPNNAQSTCSISAMNFMNGLLERDVDKRLGHGESNWVKLQKHPFFTNTVNQAEGIDWNLLEEKKLKPPFVPDNKRANFDASHELEELLLEENPLRVRKRAGKYDYSKLPGGEDGEIAQQYKLMERKFTPFDYMKKSPQYVSTSSLDKPQLKPIEQDDAVSMHDLVNVEKFPKAQPHYEHEEKEDIDATLAKVQEVKVSIN